MHSGIGDRRGSGSKEREGMQRIDSESSNPVFARPAAIFAALAIKTESYVALSHRVLQSVASRAHARVVTLRQREKPARRVSKGATRSSAPESEAFIASPCACFFCQSSRAPVSRALKTLEQRMPGQALCYTASIQIIRSHDPPAEYPRNWSRYTGWTTKRD